MKKTKKRIRFDNTGIREVDKILKNSSIHVSSSILYLLIEYTYQFDIHDPIQNTTVL